MDKQMTPLSTPDTLRKALKLLKRFYAGYTDRYMGYTDVNGYKYNGTVENFGSEIYLEARKMLMEKPPIEMVFPGNTFNFYFDISYSELIGTYEQQNLFVATLKNDVLRSNCIYKIIFRDCTKQYVLRSESWSDPAVYHDTFIMTQTNPVLQIQTPNGVDYDTEEIELVVSNDEAYDIVYSFNLNKTNYDPEHPDRGIVESYDEETGVLTTRALTFRDVNIPLIWIYSDAFNVLPDIGFVNNEDVNGHTLLTIGTDGHDKSFLYPLIYEDNYPDAFDPEDGLQWFIKVLPNDNASFVDDSPVDINYSTEVGSIIIMRAEQPWTEPTISRTITYDDSFTKIFIDKEVNWHFHKPIETDYDYDGITYNNRTYAYTLLDDFIDNVQLDSVCKQCFDITFDSIYLNPYESDSGNTVSGIHLETCSDYSDNGVLKKNGIIHSLGEFDGLPPYYKYLRDKDEHRSHLELYSIRDFNNNNVKVTNKQTSAIIMDSSIPPSDLEELLKSLNKVIVYNFSGTREWFTVGESISSTNALSSLVYVDPNTIGDDKIKGYGGKQHFIYHGDRYFSCDVIDLDPELQFARVMLITNDPSVYENNTKTPYQKPLRAIARMCDIPTDFSQIEHIKGIAPTVIIDEDYIRQYASMNDEDKNRLWNKLENKWCISLMSLSQSIGVYDSSIDLNTYLPITSETNYTHKENLNTSVDFYQCSIAIANGGSGYNVNDSFTFYLGGVLVSGIVETINAGVVETVSLDLDPTLRINIGNLDSAITSFTTTTVNGNGSGLVIDIVVPTTLWNSLQMKNTNTPYDDLFTLKYDDYGFLWFWKYDTSLLIWRQNDQLTGPKIVSNQYDDRLTLRQRSCGDVMLYNALNVQNVLNVMESQRHSHTGISPVPLSIPLESLMSFSGPDYQSAYYVIDRFPVEQSQPNYRVTYWNYFDYTNNSKLLPAYNELNISKHSIRGDALQWSLSNTYKQPLLTYWVPSLTTKIVYDEICDNIWKIVDTKPMTYRDVLGNAWIDEFGKCIAPIYRYNEFSPSTDYINMENELNDMNHDQLISYIESNYPSSYVLNEELSDSELVAYILSNWYNDPVYKCNDIYRVHEQDDVVVIDDKPVGEAPTGDYVPLVETYSDKVKFNSVDMSSEILFIFKVDSVIDLNSFVITNDEGIDVSRYSLILMNKHFYYYSSNNIWTIIP